MRLPLVVLLVMTVAPRAAAQIDTASVTPAYRVELVERLADTLARGYALPDVGAEMARRIRAKLSAGAYDALSTRRALAIALERDLDSVAHDQHLGIAPRPPATDEGEEHGGDAPRRARAAPDEMEVASVDTRIMPGNVGYLRLDVIPPPAVLAPALDRVMRAVAHTNALIIDLRTNRGGSGDGMLYLAGYFFAEPTVVARLYARDPDDSTLLRTADVGGPRYLHRPVFILTSRRTFSAGEAAAYHLKYSAHAVTVGDTTGGGAHRMRSADLNDDFMLLLPYTRVVNAVSHGDWEGVGVVPDVLVPSGSALDTAHAMALRLQARSGKLEARTLFDSSYHRPRRIWIYTPPGYDPRRRPAYPLIVAFDGAEYRDTMPLPAILDSLASAGRAPAFVAVLVDDSAGAVRIADLGNAHRMVDFLARQLIPFVRAHWHATRDPHRVIVTGSSAGGLGAAYVAFMRPDLFGNVWSQSGAFWRGAEASNDPPYEWLTAQFGASPRKDIRFVLDVGALEDHATLGGAGPNFRDANRRLRDVLTARGYAVTYTEVPDANHGEEWWIPRLPVGIVNLTAAWSGERTR